MYDQSSFFICPSTFLLIQLSKPYSMPTILTVYMYDKHLTWKHSCWIFLECCLSPCLIYVLIYIAVLTFKTKSTLKMHSDVTSNSWPVWLSLPYLSLGPGVPAGAAGIYTRHLGSFNRRAWQNTGVQVAVSLSKIPHGQLLPHHALPFQRVLLQYRGTAGLWVWHWKGVKPSSDATGCD